MIFNLSLLERAYQMTKKRPLQNAGVKMRERRRNAINKAYELLQRNPFIHYENGRMLLLSESKTEDGSPKFYETSAEDCRLIDPGVFLCHAFWEGFPCWHRAAFEIVENYFEIADESNGGKNASTVHVVNN